MIVTVLARARTVSIVSLPVAAVFAAAALFYASSAEAALPAPTGLAASVDSCWGVRLDWDPLPGADSFYVRRGAEVFYTVDLHFRDAGAPPGASDYVVAGIDTSGIGDSASAGGFRPEAPSAPAGVVASDTSCSFALVVWSVVAGADSFRVYRDLVLVATLPAPAVSYQDPAPPGRHEYGVRAGNECGWSGVSSDSGEVLAAPGAPGTPAASSGRCDGVLVTWQDIDGETGYVVSRDGVSIDTIGAGSAELLDTGAVPGAVHAYRIGSINKCSIAPTWTGFVNGSRAPAAPPPPADPAASDTSCHFVLVTWSDGPREEGYRVLRDGGEIADLPAGSTSYVDAAALIDGPHAYRIEAYNSCGDSSSGETIGERVPGLPGVPAILVATDTICSRVELAWSAAADADTYVVFRDGAPIASVLAPTLSTDDDPIVGAHAYEVRAANGCGRSASAADAGFGLPPTAPPFALVASSDSCGLVRVGWEGAAEDTGYYLYRDGLFLAETAAGVRFYRDLAGAPGPHTYRVGALGICGRSDSIAVLGVRPPDPPPAPATVVATDTVCGSVWITWSSVAGADSFVVYRDSVRVAATTGTTYQSTPPPGTYLYEVSGKNSCGEGPRRSDSGTRPPDAPSAPGSVVATDDVCGSIDVSWAASAGAESYLVLRDGLDLAETVETSIQDGAAAPGSSYVYSVIARNECGDSPESGGDEGFRPFDPPGAPSGVQASSGLCDAIVLTWTDRTGEEGYVIERSGSPIDTVQADETEYADELAPSGTSVSYRIGSFNACGPVPNFSEPAAGFRLPAPAAPAGVAADSACGGVKLAWSDGLWEDGYAIARDGIVIDSAQANASVYVDTGIAPGTSHEYAVGAFNACSIGPVFSPPVQGTRPFDAPPAPTGVVASDDQCGMVPVSWNAVAHADSYVVFRDGVRIAAVKGTVYQDHGAAPGTYAYTIRSKNSCGESGPSAPDAGTRLPDAPSAPTSPSASDTSCHFIELAWGDVANEDGYRVYRDGSPIADLAANTVLFRDAFVTSGVQHSYQIAAHNECGSAFSIAVIGERILGYPDSPVQTAATDDLCDRVTITWSYSGASSSIDSFTISYRIAGAVGWTRIGSVSSATRQFAHTVAPGTYDYLVQAHNSCGASPETAGSKDSGKRNAAPGQAAFLPGSAREVCGTEPFTLRWNRVAEATRYVVIDGALEIDRGADTTYTTTKATPGTYAFRVRAENACGAGAASAAWDVEVQAVALPPTTASVSADRCGSIRVSWTPAEASNVWIEREGGRVFLGGVSSWTDTLPAGGTHVYSIGGWNSCDTLDASATLEGFAYPLTLAAPVGVTATDGLCDSVRIVWGYFPEQVGVDSFRVLRQDGPILSTVAVLPADAPPIAVDRSVSAGKVYAYKVRAENRCALAVSAADSGFAFTRPGRPVWNAPAPSACAGEIFRLRWNPAAEATAYEIRRNGVPIDTVTGTQIDLAESAPGSPQFVVVARNACGPGVESEPWTVAVSEAPSSPEGVQVDTSACDSVVVRWTAQPDSVRVYRSDRAEPIWEGPGNGSVTDRPTRAVVYRVLSFNGCGESAAVEAALANPRTRPAAPSSVTATDAFCDSVIVTWSFPSSPTPIQSIDVVRTRSDTAIVVAAGLGPSIRRFVDTGGSGTYAYEVTARNACGASVGGPASHDDGGFLPEVGASSFSLSSDTVACVGGRFTLRWSAVPGVLFYRVLESIGGVDRVVAVAEATRDTVDFAADAVGPRVFRVQANGVCGLGPRSGSWSVNVYAPPVSPSDLEATADRCGEVRLAWNQSEGAVGGVRIFREDEPIAFVPVPGTEYVDRDVIEGVSYSYTAAGQNVCGLSQLSEPAVGSTLPGLASPDLAVPPDGAGGLAIPVFLSWRAVEGAVGYAVRVEEAVSGEPVVDTLAGPDTALVVGGLDLATDYRWRVATRSPCGLGVPSGWRTFATLSIAPSALATFPANGEEEVAVDVVIRVTFSVPVAPASLGGAVLRAGSFEVQGSSSLEGSGNVLVFDPDSPLDYAENYTFDFGGLSDVFGRSFGDLPALRFATRPAERPFGDLDGDYERDLADVDLALLLLLGLPPDEPPPPERLDLNGDGRFNVADLVLLGQTLVNDGPSILEEKTAEPIEIEARARPDGDEGGLRIELDASLSGEARATYLEIVLPRESGVLAGAVAAGYDGLFRQAPEGGPLRILLAPSIGGGASPGPSAPARAANEPLRISLVFEGGRAPASIVVRRFLVSDGGGAVRALRAGRDGVVPVASAGGLELLPNRPNPFNPETEVRYYLPGPSFVRLRVFDTAGRAVALLVDRAEAAGWHAAVWDGRVRGGAAAGSGVYFASLETEGETRIVRMTLVR